MKSNKLTGKIWLVFVVYGLIGQIAWTIENMYLNLYIYRTVAYDSNAIDAIAIMVSASAIIATVTTLLMGALSDRLGKRKIFMSIGYIIWGLSIFIFGFITKENISSIFPSADVIILTIALIIVLDCVMTFFGSTANDAAFNSWVTDVTDETNRGKVEGVLSALPLIAMLVVFGLLDPLTQEGGNWFLFYGIIGGIVLIAGILGLVLVKDVGTKKEDASYFKDIIYGFKISTIKKNKDLYIVFIATAIIGIAFQVFMPYFIIYVEYYLGIKDYTLILGVVLILASLISVFGGRIMDKKGKNLFLIISTIVFSLGALGLFTSGLFLKNSGASIETILFTSIFGILMIGGYLLAMVALNSFNRDLVPKTHVGSFIGIRMMFFVLIPMLIGPFIGSAAIKASDLSYVDEFGATNLVPSPYIFLGAAIVALIALIPIFFVIKNSKKERVEIECQN